MSNSCIALGVPVYIIFSIYNHVVGLRSIKIPTYEPRHAKRVFGVAMT